MTSPAPNPVFPAPLCQKNPSIRMNVAYLQPWRMPLLAAYPFHCLPLANAPFPIVRSVGHPISIWENSAVDKWVAGEHQTHTPHTAHSSSAVGNRHNDGPILHTPNMESSPDHTIWLVLSVSSSARPCRPPQYRGEDTRLAISPRIVRANGLLPAPLLYSLPYHLLLQKHGGYQQPLY